MKYLFTDKQAREDIITLQKVDARLQNSINELSYNNNFNIAIEIAEIWYELDQILFAMRLVNRGIKQSITKSKKQIKKIQEKSEPKQIYLNGEIVEI